VITSRLKVGFNLQQPCKASITSTTNFNKATQRMEGLVIFMGVAEIDMAFYCSSHHHSLSLLYDVK